MLNDLNNILKISKAPKPLPSPPLMGTKTHRSKKIGGTEIVNRFFLTL